MSTGTPCNPCALGSLDASTVACTPGTSNANCVRYRLGFHPWNRREEMICGHGRDYLFTISPHGKQFLVTPALNEITVLKVVWDGYAYSFTDDQEVPFPAEASEAVAAYVMWKISRNVDKNLPLSKEYEAEYAKLRLALFRDFNDGQFVTDQDEEYDGRNLSPPTNFGEFGAQDVPYLSTITTIQGSDATALEAIPTVSLPPPLMVRLVINGVDQIWILQSGTTATGPGAQRPADYAATTNEKVWIQIS
jgi:hypothetical protein